MQKCAMSGRRAVAGIALLASAAASADEATTAVAPAQPYRMDQVVVTATRSESSEFTAPFSVQSLSDDDLRRYRQVRTTPESLGELPGIMVQKTGHGQGSPFIRGFTGFRTLFLIDGIRLNNSVFRDGPNQYWNTVDPLSASRMEVVMGPASTLYGSDAVGGTVQAFTRSYEDFRRASGPAGEFYYRYADAENSSIVRAEAGAGSLDGLNARAGLSYKDFGNLEGGDGSQPNTGYDEWGVDGKLELPLSGGDSLVFAYQRVDQDDAWRTHRTIFARSWEGTDVGSEQRRSLDQTRDLAYAQFRGGDRGRWARNATVSLSWQRQEEDRFRIRSDGRSDKQGFEVDTTAIWAQAQTRFLGGDWTYGAEWYHDSVDSYRRDFNADGSFRGERIQGPVGDDADYDLVGAFVQDHIALSGGLDLYLGLRYTWAEADADKVADPVTGEQTRVGDDWDEVTGSARFSYPIGGSDSVRLFGGLSQAFRAPNLSDLTRLDSARSNEIETPVASLDPEEFTNYEVGVKFDRGRWWAKAVYYYTDIDDLIIRTPTGREIDGDREVTKKNAGDGDVQGVEFQGTYEFDDHWSLFGAGSWLDGDVQTFPTSDPVKVTEPIDRMMPTTVWAGVRWSSADDRAWAEGLITHAEEQDDLSTRDANDTQRIPPGGTPDYTTFTIRGGWWIRDDLWLSLALENLTDEDYRVHGSGQNEAGRNLVMSIGWNP